MIIQRLFVTNVIVVAATISAGAASSPSFQVVPTPSSGFDSFLLAASASSSQDIWAIGETAIHWNGTAWTNVPVPGVDANNQAALQGVATVSPDDAWAVGNKLVEHGQLIEHWDGTQWSLVGGPAFSNTQETYLYGVAAPAANDVWAVGDLVNLSTGEGFSVFEHFNGSSWTYTTLPTGAILSAVSADAPNDIWAVGYENFLESDARTVVIHYDGTSWQQVTSTNASTSDQLSAVTALAPDDVWAVGNSQPEHSPQTTLIEHWDGTSWSVVPSPNVSNNNQSNRLFGITAVSANDIYAFGSYFAPNGSGQQFTLVMHWNGTAWNLVKTPNPTSGRFVSDVLNAGVAFPGGTVLIFGSQDESHGFGTLCLATSATTGAGVE
jgi:hypothetical protein